MTYDFDFHILSVAPTWDSIEGRRLPTYQSRSAHRPRHLQLCEDRPIPTKPCVEPATSRELDQEPARRLPSTTANIWIQGTILCEKFIFVCYSSADFFPTWWFFPRTRSCRGSHSSFEVGMTSTYPIWEVARSHGLSSPAKAQVSLSSCSRACVWTFGSRWER